MLRFTSTVIDMIVMAQKAYTEGHRYAHPMSTQNAIDKIGKSISDL